MSNFTMLRTRWPFLKAGLHFMERTRRMASSSQPAPRGSSHCPYVADVAAGLHHEFDADLALDIPAAGIFRVAHVLRQVHGEAARALGGLFGAAMESVPRSW